MLLCCGMDGLLERRTKWQNISCPLPAPSLLACQGPHRAILDNTEHLLWMDDMLIRIDSGIERMLLWRGSPLLLSGDTDAISLLNMKTGNPQFLSPAGVYPQDMCLLGEHTVAVCGGGSGDVLLLRLPELHTLQRIPVPGSAQRVVPWGRWLYVLCTTEDDGLQTLLCRVDPRSCRYEPLCTIPGLPGALHIQERGMWVAVSEKLYRFSPGEKSPSQTYSGFGLIRHIASRDGRLLLSDPVLGALFLLESGRPARLLLEGDVGEASFV